MKLRIVTLAICWLAMNLLVRPAWADGDLTGTWTGQLTETMGKHDITLRLKTEGSKITGTMSGGPPTGDEMPISDAQLVGDQLSFKIKTQGLNGEPLVLVFKGKLAGNHIQGTHEAPFGTVLWEVTRK